MDPRGFMGVSGVGRKEVVFAVAVNRVVSESVEKVGAEDLIVFGSLSAVTRKMRQAPNLQASGIHLLQTARGLAISSPISGSCETSHDVSGVVAEVKSSVELAMSDTIPTNQAGHPQAALSNHVQVFPARHHQTAFPCVALSSPSLARAPASSHHRTV